jgi:hypothetical protein
LKVFRPEDYFANKPPAVREILTVLHDFLLIQELESKIRYNIPFYDANGKWLCYLNVLKNGNVELVFLNGKKMENEYPVLHSGERKMVAGITIRNIEEVNLEEIAAIIKFAKSLQS